MAQKQNNEDYAKIFSQFFWINKHLHEQISLLEQSFLLGRHEKLSEETWMKFAVAFAQLGMEVDRLNAEDAIGINVPRPYKPDVLAALIEQRREEVASCMKVVCYSIVDEIDARKESTSGIVLSYTHDRHKEAKAHHWDILLKLLDELNDGIDALERIESKIWQSEFKYDSGKRSLHL
jgi:hypothetical protein